MKMLIYRKGVVHICLFDDEDYSLINKYKWHIDQDGYAVGYRKDVVTTCKKWFKMHRLVMGVHYDRKKVIDHKNHNRIDNRNYNLSHCTTLQNSLNNKPWGKSKYRGVGIHNGKYRVRISIDGNRICLGDFALEVDAKNAYLKAFKEYHPFLNINGTTKKTFVKNV